MYIIPAIDLRDGKCVRLIQGQYDRQINYRDNPVEQAKEFTKMCREAIAAGPASKEVSMELLRKMKDFLESVTVYRRGG